MLCVKIGIVCCCCYKKVFKCVKGFWGSCFKQYCNVFQMLFNVVIYEYCDCCNKKCDFCCLWIQCINVGVCLYGMNYLIFINGLKCVNIDLNCKVLVDIVVCEFEVFKVFVDVLCNVC